MNNKSSQTNQSFLYPWLRVKHKFFYQTMIPRVPWLLLGIAWVLSVVSTQFTETLEYLIWTLKLTTLSNPGTWVKKKTLIWKIIVGEGVYQENTGTCNKWDIPWYNTRKSWLYFLRHSINTYIQQILLLEEVERRSALSAGIPACSLNKTEKKKKS